MMHFLIEGLSSNIQRKELLNLLFKQLENFFLLTDEEKSKLESLHEAVLQRLKNCVKKIDNKYFRHAGNPFFSAFHSGQYLIYLYYFSNECSKNGELNLKDKLYYLNKILHSADIYADVELPEVFFLEHPLGTVLGRAVYGNNFFAMQGCTIGGNKGLYPTLGENLKMYSNSKILGKCKIGNNVIVAANTYIKDTNIPNNTMVFGEFPNLILKPIK